MFFARSYSGIPPAFKACRVNVHFISGNIRGIQSRRDTSRAYAAGRYAKLRYAALLSLRPSTSAMKAATDRPIVSGWSSCRK
jgi:hypothetical protein